MLKRIIVGLGVGLGALLLLITLGSQPAETAPQTPVSYTALPGGKLDKIKPGDYLSVGYIYKVTDTTYPIDIGIINPKLVLGMRCNQSGWGVSLEVKMPDYRDISVNDKTNPDILQGSPDVDAQVWGYQGMVRVPDLCGNGGSMTLDNNTGQATFSAEVQGNKAARVRLKFHLRDPQAKGFRPEINCSDPNINPPKKPLGSACSGSWSSEFSAYPSQFWTPTPTATASVPQVPLMLALSGNVFIDVNNDTGQSPNDVALSGVTVQTLDSAGNVVRQDISDMDGSYSLYVGGLAWGNYKMHVDVATIPAGYTMERDNDLPFSAGTRLVPNTIDIPLRVNAALAIPSGVSISGIMYYDANADGSYTPGDGVVSGVMVQAFDTAGHLMRRGTSDASGRYSLNMSGLLKGQYWVRVTAVPLGYVLVSANDQLFDVQDSGSELNIVLQPTP